MSEQPRMTDHPEIDATAANSPQPDAPGENAPGENAPGENAPGGERARAGGRG